jgi:cell division protease FtsH
MPRTLVRLLLAALLVGTVTVAALAGDDAPPPSVTYTELLDLAGDGAVEQVTFHGGTRLTAVVEGGREVEAVVPPGSAERLVAALARSGAVIDAEPPPAPTAVERFLLPLTPLLLIVLLLVWLRGQGRFGTAGRGAAVEVAVPEPRFADVAGADEVVEDLREIVDWLRDPSDHARLGSQPPTGVLLVGPPGTGKTLLARATAGEAGVPFFAASGSDFMEMFAGLGPRRIRTLFRAARRAAAPRAGLLGGRRDVGAVVFLDELDSIGRRRADRTGGAAEQEREQTLNALLVELDGFAQRGRIVVLAATNRSDVLDPALTRPGRFDRTVAVGLPDAVGRRAILAVHARERALDPDADLDGLARRTQGMSGAELARLVTESADVARRAGADAISGAHVEEAFDRVLLGPPRPSAVIDIEDRRVTAWHEAGHAVAALLLPDAEDPVRVSVVPRGHAGGVTVMAGTDRRFLSKASAHARLAVLLAGRAAERIAFGDDYTHGASDDLRRATELATAMAADYGMSEELGSVVLSAEQRVDGETARLLHQAVRQLLDDGLARAEAVLRSHLGLLQSVSGRLMEVDQLTVADLRDLRDAPAGASGAPSSPGRPVEDDPAVQGTA